MTARLQSQDEKIAELEKELKRLQAEAMLKRLRGASKLAAMNTEQKTTERTRLTDKVRQLMEAGCH